MGVVLEEKSWTRSPVFDWLEAAGVVREEMHRSFNCGIGMIAIVAAEQADSVVRSLQNAGERAQLIGSVVTATAQRVTIV
jgi:phosphoribosylformylglycinamidine cyclo-ligase